MMAASYKTIPSDNSRVYQGDIFRNVKYYDSYHENGGDFELTMYEFPFVMVLTQDCDLEQNKNARNKITTTHPTLTNDKHLISVIVAPLYNAEHLITGSHLQEIGISTQKLNSELKKPVQNNQNPRYHFIKFSDAVPVPDSIIDFKHYFTTSLSGLESNLNNRICRIDSIYRELISQRFANYLSRIGLPDPE